MPKERKKYSKRQFFERFGMGAIFLIAAIVIALWTALSETSDSEEVVRIQVESTDMMSENTSETTVSDTVEGAASTTSTTTTTIPVTTTKKSTTSKTTTTKSTTTTLAVAFPLELNGATVEELTQIPGIGDVLAARIVAYRDEIGGFINRAQLLDVSGIGETKFAILCEYVYLTEEWDLPVETTTTATTTSTTTTTKVTTTTAVKVIEMTATTTLDRDDPDNPLRIDLNEAELEDLMLLPEMTEEIAQEILDFREQIQYFSDPYELMYVVSRTYFVKIEPYVTVEKAETGAP